MQTLLILFLSHTMIFKIKKRLKPSLYMGNILESEQTYLVLKTCSQILRPHSYFSLACLKDLD